MLMYYYGNEYNGVKNCITLHIKIREGDLFMSISKKMEHLFYKLTETWLLKGIKKGLMYSIPFMFIGSLALLVLNFPLAIVSDFFASGIGSRVSEFLLIIYGSTFDIMAIIVLLCISYEIITEDKLIKKDGLHAVVIMVVSLTCFFINASGELLLPDDKAGATGLFEAIIISVLSTKIFILLYKRKPFYKYSNSDLEDSNFQQVVFTIFPALITISIFALIKTILSYFGYDVLNFNVLINLLRKTGGLVATLLFDFVSQIMWFFGVHGNNVLEEINLNFFVNASQVNSNLVAAGSAPTEIFTKQFLDIFVFLGGSGSTLCLLVALAITRKKEKLKNFIKIYLVPGLFNINEIVLFGLPIVLNPIFFIPFIITPIVLTITTYLAMATGIVPLTVNQSIQWTTPIIMGGYLATDSIAGAILQVVNLIIGILIYLPFVKINDKHKERVNKKVFNNFISEVMNENFEISQKLSSLDGDFGVLARTLAKDLEVDIKNHNGSIFLVYQPQVNKNEKVIGCEALLRWNNSKYGAIPPPVVVRIAEENGFTNVLGDLIIEMAIKKLKHFNDNGIENIIMSINISANQIRDGSFIKTVEKFIIKTGVDSKCLEFELTENATIDASIQVKSCLKDLRQFGCRIAIDDFGMGYTSLNYLKDFELNTIKIDGSLVKDIVDNINCQEIISSLCVLCDSLKLDIIAEFVETAEQRDVLERIGCRNYQGYYFSKPINSDNLISYVENHGIADFSYKDE